MNEFYKGFKQGFKQVWTGWNVAIYLVAGCCFSTLEKICETPNWLATSLNVIAGFIIGWNIKSIRYWLGIDKL